MKQSIKLGLIPDDQYSDYRYRAIIKAYKWDPQVEDHNTVAKQVILMDRETAGQLETWAEQLSQETILMEEALIRQLPLAKKLGLPKKIMKTLNRLSDYDRSRHVRLMRFDFHPTTTGWAVSEVNSDVPGGLAEASVLPEIAGKYFEGYEPHKHIAGSLLEAFKPKIRENGTIAFVHATSYSDDRQVMQFLSDYFQTYGYRTVMAAPDHIEWDNKQAVSIVEGQEGKLDGIIRFFPLEWISNLPPKSHWEGYYDCTTPSCNHPIAIFAQSKRLPLIWNELGVDIPTWKTLLPVTGDPKTLKPKDDSWIYKPALGRVGEGISIKEAASKEELSKIEKAARRHAADWVVQQRFISQPLTTAELECYHLCIGVFTVDGKSAGFYGRISPYPRIDSRAKDIPLLVSKGEAHNER